MHRLIIFFFFLWSSTIIGQEYQMDANLPPINDCGGFFTDSGGSGQDYENNENLSAIICKNPQEGTHIRLTFNDIDLATGDKLCFYDGLSTTADSLICIESFYNGFPVIIQATAANPSGCLTVTFKSNNNGEVGSGWLASINCVPSCQLIQAVIENTSPVSVPLERGFIDICEGERIFLNGGASYPQNNLVYEHDNSTSSFEWDFGDGSFAVGNNVSHVYEQAGGYQISLKVTDQFGCTNGNFAFQRVRVATKPQFKIGEIPSMVCIGDSIRLSGGIGEINNNSTVNVCNQEGAFIFNGIRSDSLALPDGNGASYKTSIRFTDFEAGQVLTDIKDLQSICVNMEHSWLHDMEIRITCPSGNSVLLQSQEVINKEVYLGVPIDNDGVNPESGRGLEYCWTSTSSNGTLTEFANDNDNSSPNETYFLPAGEFSSFEDLEVLLGCPLNGDWVITVTDLWEQDNGWIFSWSIDINPDLYPTLETFEPQITNFQWENNPDFVVVTPDLVIAQPTSAGTANYVVEVGDNFGCTHDTSVQITVLPNNHPDCLNCEEHLLQKNNITICPAESINLEGFIDPIALGTVNFEAFPNQAFTRTSNPPQDPLKTPIQVSNVLESKVRPDASNLISVCIDLTSEFNSDLAITLISPNGVFLNLSSENGGRNDGYLNTCFTATANQSITEPTNAPFTGNYLPEESFSNLAGTDVNGIWTLQLSDDAGFADSDVNIIRSWSISFLSPTGATFTWSPAETLTCSDCTNPIATPTASTAYVLEKNFEGCQVFDTLNVTVLGENRPTDIKEVSLADGNLLVNWSPLPGVNAFEVSTDAEQWIPSNNGLTAHIFGGLAQNETFNVYVRGLYEEYDCPTKFTSRAVRYRFCDLEANFGSQDLVTDCFDSNDAFVVITASGGSNAGYTYTLNDLPPQFNNRFDQLTAGAYKVLIEDSQSCADTLNFTVIAPPALSLSFDKEDLDCFGDDNGVATVFPSGGVGDYRILQWSNTSSTNFSTTNLTQGEYWVEIADANNCVIRDSFIINEPTKLEALATASQISCFGAADGGASVKVTDGTPPYTFDWDNGQTGVSALGLDVGNYSVTIADANSCKTIRTVSVTEPPEIIINLQAEAISCPDESDGTLLGVIEGGIPPYEYKWNTGQTSRFNFGLGADQYLLTVTDSKGCEQVATTRLEVPNALVLSTSTTTPSCENDADGTATVNVVGGTGNYSFVWSDPASQTNQTATNLLPGDYEVTVMDDNGCMASQALTVNAPTALSTSFTTVPASCSNRADGSIIASVENGTGNYSFLWENGNTSDTNTDLLPGKYMVTIQDGNGCPVIDTINLTAPDALEIDSIRQQLPRCNGEANGVLEAFISGGTAPYNYNWDNNSVTSNPFTTAPSGEHILSVVDANGCIILPQTVTLADPLPLNLSSNQQDVLCFNGNDGSATISPTGGIAPYTFLWNDAQAQTAATASDLQAGVYEANVIDANGCSSVTDVTINQPESPITIEYNQTDTACFKQNQNSVVITPMGGTGTNYRFEWDNGATTPARTNLAAGTYEVSIYDENNCQQIESINLVELDSITFSIIEVKPSCAESEDGRLALSPITGGGGNGQIENYQINWSTAPTVNQEVIIDLRGNTIYQVTVTDQIGCTQSINRFLEAPEPLAISLNKEDISCFGANDGQLTIASFSGTVDIDRYDWSNNVSTMTTEAATNLSAGTYALSITDINGCTAMTTTQIEEPSPLRITDVEIISNICSGASLGKVFLSVEGGAKAYTYQWSNGTNGQDLLNVPSGTYNLLIRDTSNCELQESFNINNPDALNATIEASAISCFGDSDGRLSISPSGGVPPYVYSLNGNEYSGIQNMVGLASGDYTIAVKDNNNCIWKSNSIELVNPLPFEVDIRSDQTIIPLGDSIELTAQFFNNSGDVQWDWTANTPTTFACPQQLCNSITVAPLVNTTYELYAVDANGCEASAVRNILIAKNQKVFIPTGFTPNGDGNNDQLLIHGAANTTIKSFKVFNRWGETIFESNEITPNNSKNTWDGTFKGQPLNTGVYVWILEVSFADGTTEIFKGSTTLIR